MRIEEQTLAGFKTCGRDRRSHGDCPGYESAPISLIRETTTVTFGDMHENTSDPYWPITSHQHVRLRPADEQDWKCSHCGSATNLSLEPRAEFPRLSEHSPNELVRRAQVERDRDQRAAEALSADERSARALEQLAAAGQERGTMALEIRALMEEHQRVAAEQIAELRAQLAGNGNGQSEPDPPTDLTKRAAQPRKRTSS